MAVLNHVVEVTHIVARAALNEARQALTSAAVSPIASVVPPPTTTTDLGTSRSTIDGSAATSGNSNPSGAGSGNNATSSPLLFFVALGFGVVFTNLWSVY